MSSSWAGHEWMILRRTPQLNVSSHSWICLAGHNFYRQMGHEWPAMNLSWVVYEWFMSGSWAANSDQPIAWLFERLIGWLANPTWTRKPIRIDRCSIFLASLPASGTPSHGPRNHKNSDLHGPENHRKSIVFRYSGQRIMRGLWEAHEWIPNNWQGNQDSTG